MNVILLASTYTVLVLDWSIICLQDSIGNMLYTNSPKTTAIMGRKCCVKSCGKTIDIAKVFILNADKVRRFTEEYGYEFERRGRGAICICEDHFDESFILR